MDCPRIGKLFGGCKFSPRYDLGAASFSVGGDVDATANDLAAILEATKPKTYVRDVCETCGKTIEREGR